MRKYRILELVITRDQTRYALHAPSRSLQESPQEGTAGTEPTPNPVIVLFLKCWLWDMAYQTFVQSPYFGKLIYRTAFRLSKIRGSWFLEATDFCHPQARQIHR